MRVTPPGWIFVDAGSKHGSVTLVQLESINVRSGRVERQDLPCWRVGNIEEAGAATCYPAESAAIRDDIEGKRADRAADARPIAEHLELKRAVSSDAIPE